MMLGTNNSGNVSARPRLDADYGLAVIAVLVCFGALAYVHCRWPGPSLGQQVYASTAGPPLPIRWNVLARPECPNCGREVVQKADRCRHCGRCVAWCTAPCHACKGSGQLVSPRVGGRLGPPAQCICGDCCGDGVLGDD
ncbi:MAG: hypothetical protein ACE5JM_14400 [Armatimonadota bacterium]